MLYCGALRSPSDFEWWLRTPHNKAQRKNLAHLQRKQVSHYLVTSSYCTPSSSSPPAPPPSPSSSPSSSSPTISISITTTITHHQHHHHHRPTMMTY